MLTKTTTKRTEAEAAAGNDQALDDAAAGGFRALWTAPAAEDGPRSAIPGEIHFTVLTAWWTCSLLRLLHPNEEARYSDARADMNREKNGTAEVDVEVREKSNKHQRAARFLACWAYLP